MDEITAAIKKAADGGTCVTMSQQIGAVFASSRLSLENQEQPSAGPMKGILGFTDHEVRMDQHVFRTCSAVQVGQWVCMF